ncbi:hypothetical protein ES705_40873 [subsurface metagenome]
MIEERNPGKVKPVFINMKWNKLRLIMGICGEKKLKKEFFLMFLAHNIGR